ncbi:hypothetical protein SK128_004511, partial [Halocaridina rubra]
TISNTRLPAGEASTSKSLKERRDVDLEIHLQQSKVDFKTKGNMFKKMESLVGVLLLMICFPHSTIQEQDAMSGMETPDREHPLLQSPCKEPTQCCELFGRKYKSGEKLKGVCADIECDNGQWVFTGFFNSKCGQCHIYDDPHFKTFDGYRYDMQGTCSYRVSQTWSEHSLVVGRFKPCNGDASCMDYTIFYDDIHTGIEIDHTMGHDVIVNGESFTVQSNIIGLPIGGHMTQVLAWTAGDCNMFLGSFGLTVKTCPTEIYVWAAPSLYDRLCGLCGTFNGNMNDDFMPCDTVVSYPLNPFPLAFPIDMMIYNQSVSECDPQAINPDNKINTEDPCQLNAVTLARLEEDCVAAFQDIEWPNHDMRTNLLKPATKSCVADLCLMEQNGEPVSALDAWKMQLKEMLERNLQQEVMTVGDENGNYVPGHYGGGKNNIHNQHGCMGPMCNNPAHIKTDFLFEANLGK